MEKENQYHNLYQRKGYKIDHYYQRAAKSHIHSFLVHDQGGAFIPTMSRLVDKFVPRRYGAKPEIFKKNVQVLDPHHIQYELHIRYPKNVQRQ